jgi:hypothetical protein
LVNYKPKIVLLLLLLLPVIALAQPKPRIDFDSLLSVFPDLPWDFEIRYVTKSGSEADMLRLYYDARVDVVRWRAEYPGSLASVCHSTIDETSFRKLLVLMQGTKFNDLPTDERALREIADRGESIVSVRVGKTVVRKVDRHEREIAGLYDIEQMLEGWKKRVVEDSKADCGMESVPARP